MGLKETGYEVVDWIHLARHRIQWRDLVNMMKIWVPLEALTS